jgi:hypothetical protein
MNVFLQRVDAQQPLAVGDGLFERPTQPMMALQALEHSQEEKL